MADLTNQIPEFEPEEAFEFFDDLMERLQDLELEKEDEKEILVYFLHAVNERLNELDNPD